MIWPIIFGIWAGIFGYKRISRFLEEKSSKDNASSIVFTAFFTVLAILAGFGLGGLIHRLIPEFNGMIRLIIAIPLAT